jgi:hypothetical protein
VTNLRRLCVFAANRWLATMQEIVGSARELLRVLLLLVDSKTGKSHPRFPITLDKLVEQTGRARSTVCRVLNALESAGVIVRERARHVRMADGTLRQPPTSYTIVAPEECWQNIKPAESTAAAREPAQVRPRPSRDEPFMPPAAMVLSVRGKLSTRDAETPLVRTRKPRAFDPNGCTADLVTAEELAGELVYEGCVAAETCPEERRFVAVASLYELSRRAVEVAGEATDLGLSSSRVRAAVRQWVVRCLGNAAQEVESVGHAINILRRFMASAAKWEERVATCC